MLQPQPSGQRSVDRVQRGHQTTVPWVEAPSLLLPSFVRCDKVSAAGEVKLWVVNSNDMKTVPFTPDQKDQPLLLSGIDVEVPARLGSCKDLVATIGTEEAAIECLPPSYGMLRLHLKEHAFGQGSVLVTLRRKSKP